jgi:hypothetical protein
MINRGRYFASLRRSSSPPSISLTLHRRAYWVARENRAATLHASLFYTIAICNAVREWSIQPARHCQIVVRFLRGEIYQGILDERESEGSAIGHASFICLLDGE